MAKSYSTEEDVLGDRGWDSDVTHGGFTFTNSKFAQLLLPIQLCDDVTQVLNYHLQCCLEVNKDTYPNVIIAASRFYQVLRIAVERKKMDNSLPISLREIEERIKTAPNSTTGEARNTRWTKNSAAPEKFAPGGHDGQGDLPVGNASNAATVAASEAKKVCGTSHL